ncbi:Hypothetical protein NTJ_00889 [Nesidiocoris tenuis]|uniref:Uncharacterized protein n=1 Tax=Nesidiocoris tenuis TaxID=355587 RepID=A0ABN7A7W0_9HEMI|nr:Hypothetical protein NTJ_00889 [Nesidiocoris tenuis]
MTGAWREFILCGISAEKSSFYRLSTRKKWTPYDPEGDISFWTAAPTLVSSVASFLPAEGPLLRLRAAITSLLDDDDKSSSLRVARVR